MMLLGKRKKLVKNKIYNLASYSFIPDEKILIDANIWLYLFPAPASSTYRFAVQYSNAFANLIKAKAQPILDPIVLSEYLNRYIRIEWEANYRVYYPKFKDFRSSSDFSEIASSAEDFAQKILTFCDVHSVSADELNLKEALTEFASAGADFNDAILVNICKKRGFKLMTNDGDFQNGGIEILTRNQRLLKTAL